MVEYGFESGTGGPNVAENLLQVNVYFKSLNVRTVIEEPIYDRVKNFFKRQQKFCNKFVGNFIF